jgi:ankyrin repeat protein
LSVAGFVSAQDLRLVDALKSRDREAARSLLAEKAGVNDRQSDGSTPLHWAAYWEDAEIADLLIRAGANVNAANEYGVTPLSLAVSNRNAALAEKLLAAGANPNAAQWNGETPLMTAAGAGSLDVVNVLLAHQADVNAKEPRRGQTALMWAIAARHPEIARVLIERGADVRARSHQLQADGAPPMILEGYGANIQATPKGGFTPLLFAARVGDLETARLLIAKGADVNEATEEDGSALVIATAAGHEQLALFLLENGANPNAAGANGMTALHLAMRDGVKSFHGIDISNALRLCQSGAAARCVTIDDPAELSNPQYATFEPEPPKPEKILPGHNMLGLAKELLARGADPNAQMQTPPPELRLRRKPVVNLTGATPFLLASAAADLNAMRTLVEARAKPLVGTVISPKEFNKEGHGDDNQIQGNATPLMAAVGMGRQDDFGREEERRALEAAKILVDLGADVNQATETGWTPLHAAAFLGADTLIEFLASKGANINAKNGCGQTPLSLAEGTDARGLLQRVTPHPKTAQLLRRLGAGSGPATASVGRCVEGRFGLDYATVKPAEKKE